LGDDQEEPLAAVVEVFASDFHMAFHQRVDSLCGRECVRAKEHREEKKCNEPRGLCGSLGPLYRGANMREGQRTRQTKRDTARATTNCVDIRAPALPPRALAHTHTHTKRASKRERERRTHHVFILRRLSFIVRDPVVEDQLTSLGPLDQAKWHRRDFVLLPTRFDVGIWSKNEHHLILVLCLYPCESQAAVTSSQHHLFPRAEVSIVGAKGIVDVRLPVVWNQPTGPPLL
jgi:hypothetical protein